MTKYPGVSYTPANTAHQYGAVKLLPMTPPSTDEAKAEAAKSLFEMYRSYVDAGFDKRQAMEILLEMIRASVGSPQPPKRSS